MKVRFLKGVCVVALVCGLVVPAFTAFLYGDSSTVAIEKLVSEKQNTEASPFVSAWIKAFGNDSWKQIQKKLDDWYSAHPGDAERPVFDVLWYEFMAPADK